MPGPAPAVIFFDLGDTLTFNNPAGQRQRFDDALDTLQILAERGYRIGLLSDQAAGVTVTQVQAILQGLGFAPFVERALITISTEIPGNVGKPNRPIFDLALQKAGHAAPSVQSIFVTETASHINAARGFGWRAIRKRNTGSCVPADGECVAGLAGLLNVLPPLASLAGTNLHLAPPPRLVDGLWAVPIDIQSISATLTFNGASSSGAGDATVNFKLGRNGGNPVFDLRQTITGAWLDGAAVATSNLSQHDFGGGANAGMRILESVLAAGSAHSLRVTYSLGPPQASTAGSYQPAMIWSAGPRLAFNFGFTDLGAGRYLEAWVPANLIFDQFDLQLELRILNTAVAHSLITNGAASSPGANHWMVNFPARFTALSPLLELRPADSLASSTGSVVLPVSGANVTIEAWKPSSSAVNLGAQINDIKTYLASNENSTGRYIHANRFVAFFHVGGMEYEGGTTTSTSALRHETFHSWWARGVKPATQPDAWFDEAWTVYNDQGASLTQPFNFSDPPIELRTRNPWVRVTAGGAYTDGNRFWQGVAALISPAPLRTLMSDFYKQRNSRPVTTADLEEFLLCRTGNVQLVDAFHRFVYGFGNATPAPDLWLRDEAAHTGADQWAGAFWNSPDIWVRNSDDGGLQHQSPEFGQDNWFHARVRNRGSSTVLHFVVTFNVKQFAGTQFQFDDDFLPCVAAAPEFELVAGATRIVKARWPRSLIPAAGTHSCLLAAVLTRGDHPVSGKHVWESNNLAQKNLTIVNLKPDKLFILPFVASNLRLRVNMKYQMELIRPKLHSGLEVSLLHTNNTPFAGNPHRPIAVVAQPPLPALFDESMRLDCTGAVEAESSMDAGTPLRPDLPISLPAWRFEALFPTAGAASAIPIAIGAQQQLSFGLKIKVPTEAEPGQILHMNLVQRDPRTNRIVGGIALEVHVV